MIEEDHPRLSIRKQSRLLNVSRKKPVSPREPSPEETGIMRDLDKIHTRRPVYGQRKLVVELRRQGWATGRKKVCSLMREMGIAAIAPKVRTSLPDPGRRKYPYLLKGLHVKEPDHVWCTDITYIPMASGGFGYLVAVMDWKSRAVLSWKISNTPDTSFCLEAFREAVKVAGCAPGIFNTDQGCQFTSREWIEAVEKSGARVSMDGKGRWGIEVFFKQIKQTLQVCDFLGHSKHAIRWQLWAALLLYVLMRFMGRAVDWAHSFSRLIAMARGVIWDRIDLVALLKSYGTAGGCYRMRASCQSSYLPGFAP